MRTFNRCTHVICSRHKLPFSATTLTNFSTSVSLPDFPQDIPLNSLTHKAESFQSYLSLQFDPRFYITSLLDCQHLPHIRQVHARIVVDGMLDNLNVANKLLYLYARFKAMDVAHALFTWMGEKDTVSWSVMVGGFAKVGDFDSCFRTFRELIQCGVQPDSFCLPLVIRACRDLMDVQMGRLVHHVVCKYGLQLDNFVSAALVDMYAKCGEIDDARKVFDRMSERDVVTWTVMIGAYADSGNGTESLVLFDRMRAQELVPDKIAMVNVVNACAKVGSLYQARLIHDCIRSMSISMDVVLRTAVIHMYAKCGSVESARAIFDSMKYKNVITWSAMIAGYGYHGMGQKAVDLFHMMLSSGIKPNKITFVSLLYACSHSGLVEEGLGIFALMQDSYLFKPDIRHYTCVVDLLGRAGRLNEAVKLIEDAPVDKDEGLWIALLGACRVHGNLDVAEKAAKCLLELQPLNARHYLLLLNIYAKAGRLHDVAKIRELMTHKKLKKILGWTSIEIDGEMYKFTAGTSSTHIPRSEEMYHMLDSLKQRLEMAGYVPDTTLVLQDVDDQVKQQMLYTHSEKLAICFGLIATAEGTPIRITKNLRVCGDCHTFIKMVSAITKRVIVARDASRFHRFQEGFCSCGDYW